MTKFVFIPNDPFLPPGVLDKYLRELARPPVAVTSVF
jgi:hypothetical protein